MPTSLRSAERPIPAAEPDPSDVVTKAVLTAAELMGLRQKDLSLIIGSSEASVSRLNQGRRIDPTSKEGELSLLLLRAYRSLNTLVGGDVAAAREWLAAHNKHLGGVPAARMRSAEGLVDVVRYLDAVRGRV